ncbi:MAG: right-handed parallel beta-helix repeat-containing protein, partial [Opitutae bacterium]
SISQNGTFIALLALTIATAAPHVSAREIHVPRDFAIIQRAVDASKSGDVILVSPGTYSERLVLKPNISVRSIGDNTKGKQGLQRAENTKLVHPEGKGAGVTMAMNSRLDGFTITGVGQYDEEAWNQHHATQGEDQEMRHIGASGTPGIAVNDTCQVVYNIVHHIGYTGIAITGVKGQKVEPKIEHNICYRNMGGGIGIMRGANPLVIHNTSFENFYAGIGFSEANGTLMHNHCYRNIRAGIGISENSSPTLENNHCHHNRRAGIGIRTGKDTQPLIKNNLCTDNGMAGIGSKQNAQPRITGNTCLRNKLAGIGCKEDANATITGNTCKNNDLSGIGLNGARATLSNNKCEENGTAALGLENGSVATATDNILIGKTVVAIGVRNGSQLTAKNNKVSRNGGMPPLFAVLEKSHLNLSGSQLEGGGVAAVLVDGNAVLTDNKMIGNGPRKGGPPNFAAWVKPSSVLKFERNKVSGWRHAVHSDKPKQILVSQNEISNFLGTAIVIRNAMNPPTITENYARSDDPNAKVMDVLGKIGSTTGNLLLKKDGNPR